MKSITAIFENGVFRPTEPVALPEGTTVQIVPPAAPTPEQEARRRIFDNLSTSYETGDPSAAARHNEHQP